MTDDIKDLTDRTNGRRTFEGTAEFMFDGDTYGSNSWLFNADLKKKATVLLLTLSNDSKYADPRIDYTRQLHVEEK